VAALTEIAIIVIQAPIFILYPQPTTVMGHFTQFQSNKLLGLLDLDLMLILGGAFSVLILIARQLFRLGRGVSKEEAKQPAVA